MPEVVEELITRITIDTADSIRKAQEFRTMVDATKVQLRAMAEQTKLSFKDLGKGMIESIKGMGFEQIKTIFPSLANDVKAVTQAKTTLSGAVRQATTELNKENKELEKNAQNTRTASAGARSFGDIIKTALGFTGGMALVNTLRQIANLLKEATQSAFDFTKAIFMLATGANALRRAGVDITLADIYGNLDKLQKKFGVFSKKELVEGASAFMNLVRDMGFTKDQIFELQDAVATLAVVNGRAMDDVQRTVALALSSGYTEGLQRLGVSINRVNIALKAEELGYGRVYMTLTEAQRAEATQILLLEKTAKYAQDATKYQETLAGQIETTNKAIIDQKVAIGENLLPTQRLWNDLVGSTLNLVQFFAVALGPVITAVSDLWHVLEQMYFTLDPKNFWNQMIEGVTGTAKAILHFQNDYYKLFTGKNLPNLEKMLGGEEGIKKFFGDVTLEEAALAERESAAQANADALMDITDDLAKGMMKIHEETAKDITDAENDFQADLAKIDQDWADKRADIWKSYNEKIADITRNASHDIKQAQDKYATDVAQTNRQFDIRRAEAEAKYREKQIKAEIDYQERLKKLREGFLMDLEDALHERDARQVLRLIKQYNLQKTQAGREYAINLEEMKRAHALELAELEAQRAERLRILKEELALRIAAIQQEAAWRREEAARERDQKLADAALENEQEKAARKTKYDQELIDIEAQNQARYDALLLGLAQDNKLTSEQLNQIGAIWESVYGKNGRVENAVKNAIAWMAEYARVLAAMQASIAPLYKGKPVGSAAKPVPGKPRAKGGIDYATTATNLTIGDNGPEAALTIPLTRAFSGQQYLNGNAMGSANKNGSIDISLLLSPDLEARILRQSYEGIANVLLEVQRHK